MPNVFKKKFPVEIHLTTIQTINHQCQSIHLAIFYNNNFQLSLSDSKRYIHLLTEERCSSTGVLSVR